MQLTSLLRSRFSFRLRVAPTVVRDMSTLGREVWRGRTACIGKPEIKMRSILPIRVALSPTCSYYGLRLSWYFPDPYSY